MRAGATVDGRWVTDPQVPTLGEALAWHLRAMRAKRCRPRSIDTLTTEVHLHLADWLDRPLDTIRRREVADRHADLSACSGPYLANRVIHHLRAIYNTAVRLCEELPPTSPTIAVTFNRVERRRQPIPWTQLPTWSRTVATLRNPVRRDLQWFCLLTGLRSLDARTVRWEHVTFRDSSRAPTWATLHRPSPKGGERRAFTIPLARPVAQLLAHRHRRNRGFLGESDAGWVFPTRDRARRVVHVAEPKEQRLVDGRKQRVLPGPHRLRDTFATAAHECRVSPLDLKALLNHALPAGDVTEGYLRPSVEHLLGEVERVAAFLLERAGMAGESMWAPEEEEPDSQSGAESRTEPE